MNLHKHKRKSGYDEKWTIEFRDHHGIRRRLVAFKDKRLSQRYGQRLDELVEVRRASERPNHDLREWIESLPLSRKSKLQEWGLLDATQVAAGKSLEQQLIDWKTHLRKKECDTEHIGQSLSRVRKAWKGCGFRGFTDITADLFEEWILDQHKHLSSTTINHYIRSNKAFLNWACKTADRISANPLGSVKYLREEVQNQRRVLTVDEMSYLFWHTKDSSTCFGMTGEERAYLYLLTYETGLRWKEDRSLTISSFDFTGTTVTVRSSRTKNKKKAVLPLQSETCKGLQALLENKERDERAFPLPGGKKGAKMIRKDLAAARKTWLAEREKPSQEEPDFLKYETDEGTADFHALRHGFITNLVLSGLQPAQVQKLARHASIETTMKYYTHIGVNDDKRAISLVPAVLHSPAESEKGPCSDTQDSAPRSAPKTCTDHCNPLQEPASGAENIFPIKNAVDPEKHGEYGVSGWQPQGDSNPCRQLENVGTKSLNMLSFNALMTHP